MIQKLQSIGLGKDDILPRFDQCNGSSTCGPQSQSDYVAAVSDFSQACAGAGLPSTAGVDGNVACTQAYLKCQICSSPTGASTHSDLCGSGYVQGGGLQANLQNQMKYCPGSLSSRGDKLKDDYNDAKKAVDDDQKQMDEAEKAKEDAAEATQSKLNDLDNQLAQARQTERQAVSQSRNDENDKLNGLQDKVNGLKRDVLTQQSNMDEEKVNQATAAAKRTQDKNKADMECKKTAALQLQQQQQIIYNLLASKKAPTVTLAQQMKLVGLTSRQAWQKRMQQFELWCQQDSAYGKSIQEAEDAYKLAMQKSTAKINEANAQIRADYSEMNENINSKYGCNQSAAAADSRACQTMISSQADVQNAQRALGDQEQLVIKQKVAALQLLATKNQAYNQSVGRLQIEQLQDGAQLGAAQQAWGLSQQDQLADPDAYKTLNDKWNQLSRTASILASCDPCKQGNCQQAKAFVQNVLKIDTQNTSSVTDVIAGAGVSPNSNSSGNSGTATAAPAASSSADRAPASPSTATAAPASAGTED